MKASKVDVVWYDIGERTEESSNLLVEFGRFLMKERIYSPVRATTSGGGRYYGCFSVEDAPRIDAWLKEYNVEMVDWEYR